MTGKMTKFTGSIAKYMVLTIGVVVVIFPLYIAVVNSLKSNADMNRLSPLQLPLHPDWQNYVTAWTGGALGSAFVNTFIIIVLAVIGNIFLGRWWLMFWADSTSRSKKSLWVLISSPCLFLP
ncbi:hypothetical protein GCM10025858_29140 [Alicyclobacillus sacchari]|nr:hypothetical protein GCM10025858_29140 [Alicyclobacillus sacchari]